MAALRGTLQGNRGTVSRLGSKNSGMHSTLSTWDGEIKIVLDSKGNVIVYFCPVNSTTYRPFEALAGNVNTGEIDK